MQLAVISVTWDSWRTEDMFHLPDFYIPVSWITLAVLIFHVLCSHRHILTWLFLSFYQGNCISHSNLVSKNYMCTLLIYYDSEKFLIKVLFSLNIFWMAVKKTNCVSKINELKTSPKVGKGSKNVGSRIIMNYFFWD